MVSEAARHSLAGGIQTRRLDGRPDGPRKDTAYTDAENMVCTVFGPLSRRGGSEHIVASNSSGWDGKKSELIKFEYNDEQVYELEFSYQTAGKLRVYKNKSLILTGDTLDGAGSAYQTITSIEALGPTPFQVNVADATGYTVGHEAVFSISSGEVELDGKLGTITAVGAGFVDIDFFGLPDYSAGPTTGTLREVFEIPIPYSDADMFEADGTFRIHTVSSNDVMFLYHGIKQTRVLTRTADDAWTLNKVEQVKGPFETPNSNNDYRLSFDEWFTGTDADANDIQLSLCTAVDTSDDAGGGDIDLDIFSVTDAISIANGGLPTQTAGSGDENGTNIATGLEDARQIKSFTHSFRKEFRRWRYTRIVAVISASKVLVTRLPGEPNWNTAKGEEYKGPPNESARRAEDWALGSFSDTTGYPATATIHDSRMLAGVTTQSPRRAHLSQTGRFSTTRISWTTHDRQGQSFADLGFEVNIGANDSSPIQWIESLDNRVAVGTTSHIGSWRATDPSLGFSPGNISYRSDVATGAKNIQPIRVDNSLIFVSRSGRRIIELSYDLRQDGLIPRNLTRLAEHLTRSGVIQIEWQEEPEGVLWGLLTDGSLISCTYSKEEDVVGWNPHNIGGENDPDTDTLNGSDAVVRSISSVPSEDLLSEELWMIVDRDTSAGIPGDNESLVKRVTGSVEIISNLFEDGDDIKDARYFDSYLSASTPILQPSVSASGALSGISNPSDGTKILISNTDPLTGFTDVNPNNQYFQVQSGVLVSLSGSSIDFGIAFTCDLQETETVFSGLEIFAGKTISIYSDGRKLEDQIVYSGDNTLANDKFGANLTFGYSYKSWFEIDYIEGGQPGKSTQGKIGNIKNVFLRLAETLDLQYGDSEENLIPYPFDDQVSVSEFRDLFTGDVILDWQGDHDTRRRMRFQGDGPYPLTVQSLVALMETQGFQSG